MSDVESTIAFAESILDDEEGVPKNLDTCLHEVIAVLKEDGDVSLRKDKCMSLLDTLGNDDHLDSYVRTQVWDMIALVEQL